MDVCGAATGQGCSRSDGPLLPRRQSEKMVSINKAGVCIVRRTYNQSRGTLLAARIQSCPNSRSPVVVETNKIVSRRRSQVCEPDGREKWHPPPVPPGLQKFDDDLRRGRGRRKSTRTEIKKERKRSKQGQHQMRPRLVHGPPSTPENKEIWMVEWLVPTATPSPRSLSRL